MGCSYKVPATLSGALQALSNSPWAPDRGIFESNKRDFSRLWATLADNMAGPESEVASYLEGLAAELGETARQLRQGDFSLDKDAKKRNQLIETANNLLTTVQQPIDQLMGYAYIFPALAAARLFVDWKVFEHVPAQGSISYSALAEKVGADVSLISKGPTRLVTVSWGSFQRAIADTWRRQPDLHGRSCLPAF